MRTAFLPPHPSGGAHPCLTWSQTCREVPEFCGCRPTHRRGRGKARCAISVENNSEAYVGVLEESIKRMEGDADFRQMLVDEVGVRGWMSCVELEAALYRAGSMKCWEVLVGVS
jgi:hypothetical protein